MPSVEDRLARNRQRAKSVVRAKKLIERAQKLLGRAKVHLDNGNHAFYPMTASGESLAKLAAGLDAYKALT